MSYGQMIEDEIRAEIEAGKNWQNDIALNKQLDEGIQQGLTFSEFAERTGCPSVLRQRYISRQQSSGIAPHSVSAPKADPFVAGFKSGEF